MSSAIPDGVEARLDLIDSVIYGDVFDSAVTLEELHRYAREPVGRDELRRLLDEDPELREVVVEESGFFALRDRPGLAEARPARMERARRLQRSGRRVARLIRHVPFVRGLMLTGSSAADSAAANADADMLVIVEPGRLGTVFALLGSLSRLTGRRLFCPNFYLCESSLGFEAESVYVARELAQARGLTGDARALRRANPWLTDVFPNLGTEVPEADGPATGGTLQRLLEAPVRGALGDRVERWARNLAWSRLEVHYGGAVPAEVTQAFAAGEALRFHAGDIDRRATAGYGDRRAEAARMIEQAAGRSTVAQRGRSS